MWATPENPDRCPVALFKKFVSHRPKECVSRILPFTWPSTTKGLTILSGIRSNPRNQPHRQNDEVGHWQEQASPAERPTTQPERRWLKLCAARTSQTQL